jgi:hypothetical protein
MTKIYIPPSCVDQMVTLIQEPGGTHILLQYVTEEYQHVEVYIPYTTALLKLGGWTE